MTGSELEKQTWGFIDEHAADMSQEEYCSFLYDLAGEAKVRAMGVEEEMADEEDEE